MTDVSKVWLITCDCRALVQALAEAVLASGHNLVATAVDREPLRELVECYGDQLRVVPIDVTDTLAAESAIQAALGAFGRVDVLVLDLTKWRSRGEPGAVVTGPLPSESASGNCLEPDEGCRAPMSLVHNRMATGETYG